MSNEKQDTTNHDINWLCKQLNEMHKEQNSSEFISCMLESLAYYSREIISGATVYAHEQLVGMMVTLLAFADKEGVDVQQKLMEYVDPLRLIDNCRDVLK